MMENPHKKIRRIKSTVWAFVAQSFLESCRREYSFKKKQVRFVLKTAIGFLEICSCSAARAPAAKPPRRVDGQSIRADRFAPLYDAVDISIKKGIQLVDEQGKRIFG
ncbi:hypothetical protein LB543_29045 [Mesorhizobium sp. ESP7-2]|uniref:HlyU family transcriptional regulator n=1 Tax=Mesorhizobium sp. ESP7-2 TaxID=2876622 RepID=UPI001CCAA6C4|nr:HlyU family transcriptional regulator [Mesorhizobium sp. ESP7-2]MBZ9710753.1 hypothetical protein [Mesorhizobium sp. ESP7-2]